MKIFKRYLYGREGSYEIEYHQLRSSQIYWSIMSLVLIHLPVIFTWIGNFNI